MHTMPDQNLSPAQVAQLTRAMLSVAAVDGIQPAEAALIGQFYESSRSADMPATATFLADPQAQQFDAAALAGSPAEFADTVVLMCLMTAYADGQLSPAEREHVQAVATTLGLDAARFEAHLAQVRDDLVGALSHLPDAGSVAAVVSELSAAD
ncbi:TerB family tellurite resistance protein [Polaromonas hydrogenivorans]|uniref:TerB family tellurite resistance protein n=1 Tax=Polaromonas hydrogenivorans TaxID=335476 RepID=A0AAU7LU55_9BURK